MVKRTIPPINLEHAPMCKDLYDDYVKCFLESAREKNLKLGLARKEKMARYRKVENEYLQKENEKDNSTLTVDDNTAVFS
ncbi:hypothetical protein O9G_004647 [Rozella allomycis CSF55]|uniref:Uncharacterized protein n=1 Tax=Rozella allomycis (strain CSF55) TaxID=988480 RepID=A0A075AN04_ROZAC|nr:hypothetical protein O9G_004647 [Rozella allomycis CSF55]|eukprot:EPZ31073.1 hypothetical protein O9G_004647 [Rozella allomycis CSF55]